MFIGPSAICVAIYPGTKPGSNVNINLLHKMRYRSFKHSPANIIFHAASEVREVGPDNGAYATGSVFAKLLLRLSS